MIPKRHSFYLFRNKSAHSYIHFHLLNKWTPHYFEDDKRQNRFLRIILNRNLTALIWTYIFVLKSMTKYWLSKEWIIIHWHLEKRNLEQSTNIVLWIQFKQLIFVFWIKFTIRFCIEFGNLFIQHFGRVCDGPTQWWKSRSEIKIRQMYFLLLVYPLSTTFWCKWTFSPMETHKYSVEYLTSVQFQFECVLKHLQCIMKSSMYFCAAHIDMIR